jgi:hypothetical protein
MGATDAVARSGTSRLSRLWSSPSATTFASTAAQALQSLLVLPLVVHRFDAASVAVWALFSTIGALQNVASAGFTPTFVRATALAHGGRADIAATTAEASSGEARWDVIGEIASATRLLYAGLALASAVLLATLGSLLVEPMATATPDPSRTWIAWWFVVGGTSATTLANAYSTIVEGLGHVALLRRWDLVFSLLGTAAAAFVLAIGGDILVLLAVTQSLALARLARSYVIARKIDAPREIWAARKSRRVLAALWPAAWRSSLGVASMFGVQQASGIFYAQIASPQQVASYLLALRLLDALSSIARSPFYARIPRLVRLHATNELAEQRREIRTGMGLTYWLLLAGILVAAIAGPTVFSLLGSDVPFPSRVLWLAMGTAVILERFGAMHLQVYTTTNRIVWHVAAGGYGIIYLVVVAAFHRTLGVDAFPIAMLCGHLGWYSWYCASRSYRVLDTTFWTFERTMLLPPLALAVASLVLAYLL